MQSFVARFVKDESGATAIEYGLIAAVIATVVISIAGVGGGLTVTYNKLTAIIQALGFPPAGLWATPGLPRHGALLLFFADTAVRLPRRTTTASTLLRKTATSWPTARTWARWPRSANKRSTSHKPAAATLTFSMMPVFGSVT